MNTTRKGDSALGKDMPTNNLVPTQANSTAGKPRTNGLRHVGQGQNPARTPRHSSLPANDVASGPSTDITRVREILARMQKAPAPVEALDILVRSLVNDHGFRSAGVLVQPGSGQKIRTLVTSGLTLDEITLSAWWMSNTARHIARHRTDRLAERWPGHADIHPQAGDGLMIGLPAGQRLAGVLAMFGEDASRWLSMSRDFLSVLGFTAGLYVEHAMHDEEARLGSEKHLTRLVTLAASSQAIAATLEVQGICSSVIALVRRLLSARAGFILLHQAEDDTLHVVSYAGAGRESIAGASLPSTDGVLGQAFQTGHSQFVPDVRQVSTLIGQDVSERLGLRAMIAVPLLVRSSPIGVLGILLPRIAEDAKEVAAIQEIAEIVGGQAAAAIHGARLHQQLELASERDRRIAETFQRVMLSEVSEHAPGIEVGHVYRAALDESVVGGDFYDLFLVGGGRVALAIGDVSGKGLGAAVQTARVKFGLRAFATDNPDPQDVMHRMQKTLVAQGSRDGFVSLFFAVYDPQTRRLHYANAGHEPPYLYRATGPGEWLARTGMVLGVDLPVPMEFDVEARVIETGDQLLMYTDGLSDARCEGAFLTRPGLLKLWARSRHLPASQSADALMEAVRRFARGRLQDDAAIVVLRFS